MVIISLFILNILKVLVIKNMFRLSVRNLMPGMKLGKSITDERARVLLASGQELTEYYIQRINELGIDHVYIDDGMDIDPIIGLVSDERISRATQGLKDSYEQSLKTGKLQVGKLRPQLDHIINELRTNHKAMIGMCGLKNFDNYTYQHSVQVSVITILIAIKLGYDNKKLMEIGLGAMLHDIGKISSPYEIVNKPGRLTEEEMSEIKKHTWDGFNLIRRSEQIPLLSAHIALQHHERVDGSGYPRVLNKPEIHEYAMITAVADVFDALVSDRPYRPAFSNSEALEILEQEKHDGHLAPEFVDLLKEQVTLYPPSTVLKLSSGDIAVVIHDNHGQPRQPAVKLLFNENREFLAGQLLDLSMSPHITVERVFNLNDSEEIISNYLNYSIT